MAAIPRKSAPAASSAAIVSAVIVGTAMADAAMAGAEVLRILRCRRGPDQTFESGDAALRLAM
jgi:hypothetical protein